VPDGEGAVDYPCGRAPIRLNPEAEGEVVWSERLDPARSILRSIPLPESGFRFADVVLNDGAATGYRKLDDDEVPVFNCLGLLQASRFSIWVADVQTDEAETVAAGAFELLHDLANERALAAEDWSTTIRLLCNACSEGRPHSGHDHFSTGVGPRRRVAVAAPEPEQARRLLDDWEARVEPVTVLALDLALDASG
jgi:hypothetical protein